MLSKKISVRLITGILLLLLTINITSGIDEVLSGSDYPFNYKTLNIDLDLSGNITLTGQYHTISTVKVKLNQYPKESPYLTFDYFNPNPTKYQESNNSIIFQYDANDIEAELQYKIFSRITNNKNQKKITIDPKFPITTLPTDYTNYLSETENIDSNSEMRTKASNLIDASKGVFDATFRIAEWVNKNIEYELSFETQDNIQKATWSYENRKGVCDEKTAVFISMIRSVGIPTRYISGLAYTNTIQEYGHHAWAEVYFPNYGWVPFDVTYGQFGWLDASHIPLAKSTDSRINAVEVTTTSTGTTSIIMNEVNFETRTISEGSYEFPNINITLEPLSEEISYGSYNIIKAEITNKKDYYEVLEISASNIEQMSFVNSQRKFVLVPPKGKATVNWAIKINDSLKRGTSYRFPFNVYLNSNKSKTTYFNVNNKGIIYSETYVNNVINNLQENQEKTYVKFIETNCENKKRIFIVNETSNIKCVFNNNAVDQLETVQTCLFGDCKEISFKDKIEKEVEFNPVFTEIGLQTRIMNISNNNIHKNIYLNFDVRDVPNLNLEISAPTNLTFDEVSYINIDLRAISISRPKKLNITFSGAGRKENWEYPIFNTDQRISVETKGQDLFKDENEFTVKLQWEDDLGRKYEKQSKVTINLINLNLWQKLYAFVNKAVNN